MHFYQIYLKPLYNKLDELEIFDLDCFLIRVISLPWPLLLQQTHKGPFHKV